MKIIPTTIKSNLILLTTSILLASCGSKESTPTPSNPKILGKWRVSEFIVNGQVTPATLQDELSFVEFRNDGSCTDYSYADYTSIEGRYTMDGSTLTIKDGQGTVSMQVTDITNNSATMSIGSEVSRIVKTNNEVLFYLEPVKDFGASKTVIKAKERRSLKKETSTGLNYYSSNVNEESLTYLFENGVMVAAGVFVPLTADSEKLAKFLSDRYTPIGQIDEFYIFQGSGFNVMVKVESTYCLVMYSGDNSKSKSLDKSYYHQLLSASNNQ